MPSLEPKHIVRLLVGAIVAMTLSIVPAPHNASNTVPHYGTHYSVYDYPYVTPTPPR
jgi:hypothetical protein